MQIVITLIRLVCISYLASCNNLISNETFSDSKLITIASCSANCMGYKKPFDRCYEECKNTTTDNISLETNSKIPFNYDIHLLCRDDTTLAFKIILKKFEHESKKHICETKTYENNSNKSSANCKEENRNNEIYVIKIVKEKDPSKETTILSNSSYIKVEKLEPGTIYDIRAIVGFANYSYTYITQTQKHETLNKNYTPGPVRNPKVLNYSDDEERSLKAVIVWSPPIDKTCHYEIIFFSTEKNSFNSDMKSIEIRNLEDLYNHTIQPLHLGANYTIGIRSKNTKDDSKESDLTYLRIQTPSCLERYDNNLTICPPVEPENLQVTEETNTPNKVNLNISWDKPALEPDYYFVKVMISSDSEPNHYEKLVEKGKIAVLIQDVALNGLGYDVEVSAISQGGNTTSHIHKAFTNVQITAVDHTDKTKYLIAIIVPVIIFALITIFTLVICHRRAKIRRDKERCKYFEDLEKKAPMDPNSNFEIVGRNISLEQLQLDLEDKLFFNDEMEIKLDNIELYEVIGEGAFGFVRRGRLKTGENSETDVAVKMLKDQPTLDDIRTFRREIEVMKSVGKHDHIVNIVGHHTKNIKEMMLLTEYCSLGNLLDLLRSEWKRVNKIIYIQKTLLTPSNSPPALPPYKTKYSRAINFNIKTGSYSISNIKRSTSSSSSSSQKNIKSSKSENNFNFRKTTLKYTNIDEDNRLRMYNMKRSRCSKPYSSNNNSNHTVNIQLNEQKQENHQLLHYRYNENFQNNKNNELVNEDTTTSTSSTVTLDDSNQDVIKFNNHILKQKLEKNHDIRNSQSIDDKTDEVIIDNKSINDGDDLESIQNVSNQVYDSEFSLCTNFCKCQVDIIDPMTTNATITNDSLATNQIVSSKNNIFPKCLTKINSKHVNNSQLLVSNTSDDKIHEEISSISTINTITPNNINDNINSNNKFNNNNNNHNNNNYINSSNIIQIKNCDCKLKHSYRNKNIVSNNILCNNDTNTITTTTTTTTTTETTPINNTSIGNEAPTLIVENQGYYKFLNLQNSNKINYNPILYNNDESLNQNPQINHSVNNENDNNAKSDNEYDKLIVEGFNSYDLLVIAKQIAMGMEYLSKCKIIHRDLAARNVLVCKDRTVKIADFGLSRDIYQENMYKKTGNGKLPIKWLALESMTHQVYTTQSDVWSYGILLYEISTLGGTPYPSISTNSLLHLLKEGYRMERPKNCGQELYDLMLSCWNAVASQRPTFTDIIQNLDDILKLSDEIQIGDLGVAVSNSNDKRSKSVSDESYLNPLL